MAKQQNSSSLAIDSFKNDRVTQFVLMRLAGTPFELLRKVSLKTDTRILFYGSINVLEPNTGQY